MLQTSCGHNKRMTASRMISAVDFSSDGACTADKTMLKENISIELSELVLNSLCIPQGLIYFMQFMEIFVV